MGCSGVGRARIMSQSEFIAIGGLVVVASIVLSLLIANWRERLWLRAQKAEDLYYKIEQLHLVLYNFFRKVHNPQEAAARLHNVSALTNIEHKVVDLKIQIGIFFADLSPRFEIILSATSTTYDALERLADAAPQDCQGQLESLDFAVANLKESLKQFKDQLIAAGRPVSFWRHLRQSARKPRRDVATRSVRVT
jgi:hypothetical protein